MLLYWIIGIIIVVIAALIIIKLIAPNDSDPDSKLGILEHPSTFKKQSIEYVDKSLTSNASTPKTNNNG